MHLVIILSQLSDYSRYRIEYIVSVFGQGTKIYQIYRTDYRQPHNIYRITLSHHFPPKMFQNESFPSPFQMPYRKSSNTISLRCIDRSQAFSHRFFRLYPRPFQKNWHIRFQYLRPHRILLQNDCYRAPRTYHLY